MIEYGMNSFSTILVLLNIYIEIPFLELKINTIYHLWYFWFVFANFF